MFMNIDKYQIPYDVTNPPLEEIDSAMYRMNLCDYPGLNGHDNVYIEDESEFLNEECDVYDDEFEKMPVIEEIGEAKGHGAHVLKMRMRVPKALLGYLIGKKGQTKLRLEQETMTRIVIPKREDEGDVVVTSSKEKYLKSAYPLIRSVIVKGRDSIGITHFVSIPLNTPSIRERFETFKEQVLKCSGNNPDINEALFSAAERLHLTLTVLTLLDEDERSTSRHTLDECRKSIIEPLLKNRPIVVPVRGITIMNDDPTQARVLFAKVESPNDILQRLADEVYNFFLRDGLTKSDRYEREHVKLHVTLMNTRRYLKEETVESSTFHKRQNSPTFDASKILENFHDFDFGVVAVNSLHLSQIGAYSEDGYYLSSNRIKWA